MYLSGIGGDRLLQLLHDKFACKAFGTGHFAARMLWGDDLNGADGRAVSCDGRLVLCLSGTAELDGAADFPGFLRCVNTVGRGKVEKRC